MAIQSEEQLQAQCYQWFHNTFPALRGLLFHIPNGGNRSMREGAKFKAIGVIAGIPDLMLCISSSAGNGLFIEMKAEGGKLSNSQEIAHDRFIRAGYVVRTVNNFTDFKQIIADWLSLSAYYNSVINKPKIKYS